VGTPDVEVYHALPRVLAALAQVAPDRSCKRVALTTWETTPMPEVLVEPLTHFDGVIVPSEFCADLLVQSGVVAYDGVYLVPHGFDETFWKLPPATHGDALEARSDAFRFYSIGAWGERKNMLGLLRAYLHAFTKADRVQLMLLIDNANFDEVRSVIARSGLHPSELPELYIPDHKLTEDELVELHGAADCFVTATRGEGWGLGMFEAAIMGRTVIAPLCGGQSDFLDNYAWTEAVPFHMTPCFGGENRARVEERDGQRYQVSVVDLPSGVTCKQSWAEPDLVAMAASMRAVYERRHIPRTEAELASERAVLEARFGYTTVGSRLAQVLRGIVSQ
jgi:glycosyltransferase involved in cell wall biosynthesis